MDVFAAAASVSAPSHTALEAARERQLHLTKPPYALGRLEEIANRLSAISGEVPPAIPARPALAVFAGDHGVLASGVSPWPAEVTTQMVYNFLAGGAAVNVLARRFGIEVTVVDMGVASELEAAPNLIDKKVAKGTMNIATGPAMTKDQARQALQAGFDVANALVDAGYDILLIGDMGIGNTTPSAALVGYFCNLDAMAVTGRGTGIDDDRHQLKAGIVAAAIERATSSATGPIEVLAEIGGFEHGGIAGYIIGAAYRKVPVVLDGVIANAAALVAQAICPDSASYAFAGHVSREPGALSALAKLGLQPIVDLDLALGEGTGAVLSFASIAAAAALLGEMATFDEAGVTEK